MPITQWCWRCQKDVPMLDEQEWQTVAPLLGSSGEPIQRLRPDAPANIFGYMALAKYKTLTGYSETDLSTLLHHRAELYGPPCTNCGKPLRSPRASICAACGHRHRV